MANQYLTDTFGMKGKYCLVTGASSGLGAHFAMCYAKSGAAGIALLARSTGKLQALEKEIKQSHPEVKVVVCTCDVQSRESVRQAFDDAEQAMGSVFDVIVNNAGAGAGTPFLEIDDDNYNHVQNVNVRGVWYIAQEACLRLVKAKQEGSVINISSILGLRVGVNSSQYAASKAAVVQMTKAIALEMAPHKIRCNVICPGYYLTAMTESFMASPGGAKAARKIPSRRYGNLKELDGALLLLSSNASSNMTGAVVAVDGGHLVSSL